MIQKISSHPEDQYYDQYTIVRLLRNIQEDENGCWIWQGYKKEKGYGNINYKNKIWLSHRLSFKLIGGNDLIPGMVLDHFFCDKPPCINPDHLKQVTSKENTLRGTGPTAENSRKKKCIRGHPLSGDNLYVHPNSKSRNCKACSRLSVSEPGSITSC